MTVDHEQQKLRLIDWGLVEFYHLEKKMVHALLLGVAHNQGRRKGIGHSLYYEWIEYYIKIFSLIILLF